ncbi:MAG: ATP-binding cassette domain-containing protein, partial [Vicinamibacterales bacterium]|nr:ATP-binding cassette domain-containing protein [Vicinamibacterales bacterium]
MLELTGVTKYYGGLPAVRDVSFTARPGEVLGYLGPNGSGKSTTVKMVTGLLTPSAGTITYQGRDIQQDLLVHRRR